MKSIEQKHIESISRNYLISELQQAEFQKSMAKHYYDDRKYNRF